MDLFDWLTQVDPIRHLLCNRNAYNGFIYIYVKALCEIRLRLTDSYIIFTLKMESVPKYTVFGLKIIVKSGLEKIFLKFLHMGD